MLKVFLALTSFLFISSAYGQFVEGTIVDQHGGKYPGFMRISKADSFTGEINEQSETLIYKESLKSKKEELTVKDLSAFKMGEDSFLVLRNFQLPLEDLKLNKFAKVLMKGKDGILCSVEEIKYASQRNVSGYVKKVIKHYLIYRKGQFTPITDYNFHQDMHSLVADHNTLSNKINSKTLTFRDIEEIAAEYETWRKNRQN